MEERMGECGNEFLLMLCEKRGRAGGSASGREFSEMKRREAGRCARGSTSCAHFIF